jgi:ATP synthase proteolipid subunit
MGVTSALVFANIGAAYGTAKSGVGICSMGVLKPDLIFKSIVPIIMAGILGIYGLIVAVILNGKVQPDNAGYTFGAGYRHLASGLTCGLSSLAAGFAIGIVGDAGMRRQLAFQKTAEDAIADDRDIHVIPLSIRYRYTKIRLIDNSPFRINILHHIERH